MSIQVPVSSVAMRCVSRMSKFPSYNSLRTLTTASAQFQETLLGIIHDALGVQTDWDHLGLDLSKHYSNEIKDILKLLPQQSSLSYDMLQLEQDFETLKKLALDLKIPHTQFGTEGVQKLITLSRDRLHFFEDYKSVMIHKSDRLAHCEETFGLIAYLEEIYLFLLYSKTANRSSVLTRFVQAKINTYTLLNALKRIQKGQSQEHILRHSIPVPGISAITALKSFGFGDLVGEIGAYLGIEPTQITVARIEQELLLREIKAINKAQFSGVGEERIIQYLEQLRYLISTIKLIIVEHTMTNNTALSEQRYISYSSL